MELEGLFEQGVVVVIGLLDVEPETLLALTEAFLELAGDRLDGRSLRGDQISRDVLT
jgi:hypothetical protein